MKKLFFLIPVVIFIVYKSLPEKSIIYPAGILVAEDPKQVNLTHRKEWQRDEFSFRALAEYKIKGRVLSMNFYSLGKESELSPVDLALGWGRMSDQNIIDKITVTQSNRWYHWETESMPIPRSEISKSSANVHIIPKDDSIKDKIDELYKGSLIEMKGFLVEVKAEKGWRWKSSLTRDDTGGGACELFWVDDIEILNVQNYNGELQ